MYSIFSSVTVKLHCSFLLFSYSMGSCLTQAESLLFSAVMFWLPSLHSYQSHRFSFSSEFSWHTSVLWFSTSHSIPRKSQLPGPRGQGPFLNHPASSQMPSSRPSSQKATTRDLQHSNTQKQAAPSLCLEWRGTKGLDVGSDLHPLMDEYLRAEGQLWVL